MPYPQVVLPQCWPAYVAGPGVEDNGCPTPLVGRYYAARCAALGGISIQVPRHRPMHSIVAQLTRRGYALQRVVAGGYKMWLLERGWASFHKKKGGELGQW